MFNNLECFKKIDSKILIFITLISGLFFILVPQFFAKNNRKKPKENNEIDFVRQLENDLSKMISRIENAGESSVLITLDEGKETIYATENKKNKQEITDENSGTLRRKTSDDEKKYITTRDSNGNENPLIVKKLEPKIRGAIVACQGFDNKNVKENIIRMVSVALDINPSKICVTKLKN